MGSLLLTQAAGGTRLRRSQGSIPAKGPRVCKEVGDKSHPKDTQTWGLGPYSTVLKRWRKKRDFTFINPYKCITLNAYSYLQTKRKVQMDTHTTVLTVVISDEILDVFNFPCFSVFSNLSVANMFSCEMKVGEESTCQLEKKKPTKMNQHLTLPAGSCHGRRRKRKCKGLGSCRRKHARQHGGGWGQELGSGEGCDTCFEDKLWAEDFLW